MDPGIGLVVNSMVPVEIETPTPPSKPPLQLPDGFLEKSHVRHALKFMPDDEQRERALEVAMAWKKKFAAERWKFVVEAIETASKEDDLRIPARTDHQDEHTTVVHSAERPRAMTAASAPIVFQTTSVSMAIVRTEPIHLHTATVSLPFRQKPAPITPRTYRWDVIPEGPVTPLSPTPMGNSFSGGGFWEAPAQQMKPHQITTPVTAVQHQPASPIILKDEDARAVYERVKEGADALARKYCLARHDMHVALDENGFIPASRISSKDARKAAETVLTQRKLNLKDVIVKNLPSRLQSHAIEEADLQRQLCIKDEMELSEQYNWMNNETFVGVPDDLCYEGYEAPIHLAVSVLDEQREALRMFRAQRKHNDLELVNEALESAWAVRILEDAERLIAFDTDGSSSDGEEDDGYSYANFLRSIKSEMSTSTSSGTLASMVQELSNSNLTSLRSRANTHQTVSSARSKQFRFPQRLSTSPVKDKSVTETLSKAGSFSSHQHSKSLHRRVNLQIVTETIGEVPSAELSPEDREFRHRGPNLVDLNSWAEELKKMEAMRADRHRSPTLHLQKPARTRGLESSGHPRSPTKRVSVDSINTRMFPTKQLHSRFSSSSSLSIDLLKPIPRPSFVGQSPPPSRSVTSRRSVPDHEYHQRSKSNASFKSHKRDISKASMHDLLRRNQHMRSTSNVDVLVRGNTREQEDEWMSELKRMESHERVRQGRERVAASLLSKDGEHTGCDDEVLKEY